MAYEVNITTTSRKGGKNKLEDWEIEAREHQKQLEEKRGFKELENLIKQLNMVMDPTNNYIQDWALAELLITNWLLKTYQQPEVVKLSRKVVNKSSLGWLVYRLYDLYAAGSIQMVLRGKRGKFNRNSDKFKDLNFNKSKKRLEYEEEIQLIIDEFIKKSK